MSDYKRSKANSIGDVLLVTRCWDSAGQRGKQLLKKPAWFLCGENPSKGWLDIPQLTREGEPIGVCPDDEYTIVPPKKWPDEVHALVAKYILLGEGDK